MTQAAVLEKIGDDVLSILYDSYTLRSGQIVQGQSLSFLESALRNRGWKRLGNYVDFVALLEEAGFKVGRGRGHRHHLKAVGGEVITSTTLRAECDVVYI